jgi:hypothetical protein
MVDKTVYPNAANEGIAKSLAQQVGGGRGDAATPGSSRHLILRDPFRSIRRGRQIFQRKFTAAQGRNPVKGDLAGNVGTVVEIGAGAMDSCAGCHGRPRGSAGFGGDVVTRPDSRDAPHLFGLGLKEMLADEITSGLRTIRAAALTEAQGAGRPVRKKLQAKGIDYGEITVHPNGRVDSREVEGVDTDLRVRPFFLHGGTISIREFVVGAFQAEMGLQTFDPDLAIAAGGGRITTPAGMVLDGLLDRIEPPPVSWPSDDRDGDGVVNEIDAAIVDYMEFYLLNYFKPALDEQNSDTRRGRELMDRIGCTHCHVADLQIGRDRRVADVETSFDPQRGIFNNLFATASALFTVYNDGTAEPPKLPNLRPFTVRNIFTDFKRHDLGPNFHEINYDGTLRRQMLTTALWGVGNTGPYGHDGRSTTLRNVILRHGGEAAKSRDHFAALADPQQHDLLRFLESLVLFPPDDTASNLDPGDPSAPNFPQFGHGSIRLSALFNNPADPE